MMSLLGWDKNVYGRAFTAEYSINLTKFYFFLVYHNKLFVIPNYHYLTTVLPIIRGFFCFEGVEPLMGKI